jgi:hypothetical protein
MKVTENMTNTVLGFCNVPHISPLGVDWVSVFLLRYLSVPALLEASLHRVTTCFLCLDGNNIYGWAMSQALPVDGFRWLEKEELEYLNINSVIFDFVS